MYKTKVAYESSLKAIKSKKMRKKNIVMRMNNVLYVSTTIIRKLDSELNTFLNINTPEDWRE